LTYCIGLDVETSKKPNHLPWLDDSFLVSIGVAREDGTTQVWVFNHSEVDSSLVPDNVKLAEIQKEIDNAALVCGHNFKFDLYWLSSVGLVCPDSKVFCTSTAEYILSGQQIKYPSLDYLSKRYGIPDKIDLVKTYWDSGYETDEIPLSVLNPYLEQDCINTLAIYQRQRGQIRKEGLSKVVRLHCGIVGMLADVETNGMRFDSALAAEYAAEYAEKIADIDSELIGLFGFDIRLNSDDELSAGLYGGVIKREGTETVERELKGGRIKQYERKCITPTRIEGLGISPLPRSQTKKDGYYFVNKNVLAKLKTKDKRQKRVLKLLQERSKLEKQRGTYFVGLPKKSVNGIIHPSFNNTATNTGRFSSSNPNGQNLPKSRTAPVKRLFLPRYDQILNVDLSQIEWRVVAFFAQDWTAIKEIADGLDAHTDNAIKFFGDAKFRDAAKALLFGLIYGRTAQGFFDDPNMPKLSRKAWQIAIDRFYQKYSKIKEWQNRNIKFVEENGYLKLPSGRILRFKRDLRGNYSENQIKNYPVQGFASGDIVCLAMLLIRKELKKGEFTSLVICQVHDSLVLDCPNEEVQPVAKICLDVFRKLPLYISRYFGCDFNVRLAGDAEAGPNYGEIEKISA